MFELILHVDMFHDFETFQKILFEKNFVKEKSWTIQFKTFELVPETSPMRSVSRYKGLVYSVNLIINVPLKFIFFESSLGCRFPVPIVLYTKCVFVLYTKLCFLLHPQQLWFVQIYIRQEFWNNRVFLWSLITKNWSKCI